MNTRSYIYKIRNVRVVDGDTVDCDIDLGFNCWLHDQRIRLTGIDAPEVRTRDLEEKEQGFKASLFLKARIQSAHSVFLQSDEFRPTDKFGRILGTILIWDGKSTDWFEYEDIDLIDVNDEMLDEGLVKEYHGGKRS